MVIFTPDEPGVLEVAVGEVYYVPRELYDFNDPKPGRPVVVLRAPTKARPHVVVYTRTTDTKAAGVGHPADPELDLDEDGVWQPIKYEILHRLFVEDNGVVHKGELSEPYRARVLVMWARQQGRL